MRAPQPGSGPLHGQVSLGCLGAICLLSSCGSLPVGAPLGDARVDATPVDSGLSDATLDASMGDGGTGQDGSGPDGGADPCGGSCGLGTYDACSCSQVDPCGWRGNGVCDDPCRSVLPGTYFPDHADCDLDLDGLYDTLEAELATQFEPYLWLSHKEEGYRDDRLPHYAVWPTTGTGVSIFYALSYYRDYGDPDLWGLSSHPGDSEVVVVEVNATGPGPEQGPYTLGRVFLSAHYGTASDGSGWFDLADIQVHADPLGA
ncbi:MAG: hypothetical protein RBU30_25970 [Polyangia bacterium]|nr:hypothetical protein [Polyangia bacterium]